MSLNDELTKYFPSNSSIGRYIKRKDLYDSYESSLGSITSRDSIINPYDYINISDYGNSAEDQARYNQELARLQRIAEMQEASYQDWFNSPEQMAIRQREAGLNPDLVGIDGTASASDTQMPEGSPLANIPTDEQNFASIVGGISSIVGSLSSVASLATAFSSFGLVDAQKGLVDAQENLVSSNLLGSKLSNLQHLQSLLSSDISDLLATDVDTHFKSDSLASFDYDSWFANDDNFSTLASVYGKFDNYDSALALARKQSLRYHKNASSLQKDALSEDFNFASIAADPRLSPSQKLTAIQIRPYMSACIEADRAKNDLTTFLANYEKSVKSLVSKSDAAGAINASNKAVISESEYKQDYYSNVDAKLVAEFEQFLRNSQSIAFRLENRINQGYISLYDSDPNGYNGARAAYLYGSNGGHSWSDAFILHNDANINAIIDSLVADAQASKDTSKLRALSSAIGNHLSVNSLRDWSQNNIGWSNYRKQMLKYIESLQKISESIDFE